MDIGIELNIADGQANFIKTLMQHVHIGEVSAHVLTLHVMTRSHLKLVRQVLFKLSTLVAMDQDEFLPQGSGSLLPLDLQKDGIVHSIVDQLTDLSLLLLPGIDRGLMFVEGIL